MLVQRLAEADGVSEALVRAQLGGANGAETTPGVSCQCRGMLAYAWSRVP